jgi:hypothetical protein
MHYIRRFLTVEGQYFVFHNKHTDLKNGFCNTQPRIGILCKKTASVGQKPLHEKYHQQLQLCIWIDYSEMKDSINLKSMMNPYVSRIIPKIGHPITTKKKPAPNEIVPCTIKNSTSSLDSRRHENSHNTHREQIRP